ncbi:restriction endonuclease subunit S [Ligilactobacillus saerimneri]|uniref:Type I R/M system specificity subunit n=1 Tax=Ligilactobacillus saerimneri 30a TaxID=1227363 RepID=M5J625_9LACO|nr:restriction endonuclease subunit S [Ligilactobacillus saerimneri]EKW99030.1 type I R/M system specificity subunit [Ligilactobacillus saerimneri 30a]
MDKKKNGIPKLRFPGFTGAWEQRKVSDIFTVTRGQVLATTKVSEVKTNEMCFPVYSSQTKNNGLMGYYNKYLFNTAITWTTDGANAGTVNYREGKFYSTNVNGVLLSDDGYANKAIAEILDRVAWRHVSRVGNPKLMNNVMSNIKISIPSSFEEQNAISEFLTKFDHLIALHQRKLDHLKEQKKGLLQKMFPKKGEVVPEVRFPGFTNAWEQRKLESMAQYKNGKGHEGEQSDSGEFELVNLNSISIDGGFKHSGKFVNESNDEMLLKNDLVMILSDVGHGDLLGRVALIPDNNKFILNQRVALIRPNNTANPEFLFFYINKHQKYFKSQGAGMSQLNISKASVENFSNFVPKMDEQRKIALFLIKLDSLIALHQRKLDHLKLLKKGLLQQMFV